MLQEEPLKSQGSGRLTEVKGPGVTEMHDSKKEIPPGQIPIFSSSTMTTCWQ